MPNDRTAFLDPLIEDRYFRAIIKYPKLYEITKEKIDIEDFSTPTKQLLYQAIRQCYGLFHNKVPENFDIIKCTAADPSMQVSEQNLKLLNFYVDRIEQLPAPEWEWILAKIDEQVKGIKLHKSLFNTIPLLESRKYNDAEQLILETIRDSKVVGGSSPNDLEITADEIKDLTLEDNSLCFPTRVYALDDAIKGCYRKEVFVVMAPTNVGKSWAMIHLAVSALCSGMYVLYVTLEMSKQKVMRRFLQNIAGAYDSQQYDEDLVKEIDAWNADAKERCDQIEVPTLRDINSISGRLEAIRDYRGKLSIYEYPSGVATMGDIEQRVHNFDITFGKPPDVIIIDGITELRDNAKGDSNRRRLGLTDNIRKMREVASDYNASVITTHQANRTAVGVETVGIEHSGESFGIMQVADTAVSLNQTKEEHALGKLRLVVMRARNQRKGTSIVVVQSLDIGQFCLDSFVIDDPVKKARQREIVNE